MHSLHPQAFRIHVGIHASERYLKFTGHVHCDIRQYTMTLHGEWLTRFKARFNYLHSLLKDLST